MRIEAYKKTLRLKKERVNKEVFMLRANGVMCYGISRRLSCCDFFG